MDAPMGDDGSRWVTVAPPGAQTAFTLSTGGPQTDRQAGGFSGVICEVRDVYQAHETFKKPASPSPSLRAPNRGRLGNVRGFRRQRTRHALPRTRNRQQRLPLRQPFECGHDVAGEDGAGDGGRRAEARGVFACDGDDRKRRVCRRRRAAAPPDRGRADRC